MVKSIKEKREAGGSAWATAEEPQTIKEQIPPEETKESEVQEEDDEVEIEVMAPSEDILDLLQPASGSE